MNEELPTSYTHQRGAARCRPQAHWWPALPSYPFQVLFTLLPESFSTFPRDTCSLSVSRRYLALREVYRAFRAAIPNNSTRRTCIVRRARRPGNGRLTHSAISFQRTWSRGSADGTSTGYNSRTQQVLDSNIEHYPLHSPLLRVSIFLSFPPLINMLKFRG